MYLSQIEIKKYSPYADGIKAHSFIENTFSEEFINGDNRTRKLWRLDKIYGKTYLLLLSQTKPNKEKIEQHAVKDSLKTTDYNKFLENLDTNRDYRFKLKLNPIKRNNGKERSIRDEELIPYFYEKIKNKGFKIDSQTLMITEKGQIDFIDSKTCPSVTFEGFLKITDLEKFKETLITGIGRKKAYGFGMLTIIPV